MPLRLILLNSLTVETNPEDSVGNSSEDEKNAKDEDKTAETQNAEHSRIKLNPVLAQSDAIDADDSNGNSKEDENDAKDQDKTVEKGNAEHSRIEPTHVSAQSDAIGADGEERKDDSIQVLLSSIRLFQLFTPFSQLWRKYLLVTTL